MTELADIRQRLNFTEAEMAESFGLDVGHYIRLESGDEPMIEAYIMAARYLSIRGAQAENAGHYVGHECADFVLGAADAIRFRRRMDRWPPIGPFPGLELFLREIEVTAENHAYAVVLLALLHLPERCGAMEHADGRGDNQRYKAWFEQNLADAQGAYHGLTAEDCYSLRCGVMHQGRVGRPGMLYDRVVFLTPRPHEAIRHGVRTAGVLLELNLLLFMQDVLAAVRRWMAANADNPTVQGNMDRMMQFRVNGVEQLPLPMLA